jgi:hypothetical protein
MTDKSVRKFQDQANLEVDGKAGMITLHKLDGILAKIRDVRR